MELLITGRDADPRERGTWYSPAAVREMIALERKECAKECDSFASVEGSAQECAAAIRARGE
jgi:hypothetical protein